MILNHSLFAYKYRPAILETYTVVLVSNKQEYVGHVSMLTAVSVNSLECGAIPPHVRLIHKRDIPVSGRSATAALSVTSAL